MWTDRQTVSQSDSLIWPTTGLLSDLIMAAPAHMYEANNRRGVAGPTRPTGLIGLVWNIARNIHQSSHLTVIITSTTTGRRPKNSEPVSGSWSPPSFHCPHSTSAVVGGLATLRGGG